MKERIEPTLLDNMFDSITDMTKGGTAVLTPKDSTAIDIDRLIKDNIYGLLSEKELNLEQISLLTALLQCKTNV